MVRWLPAWLSEVLGRRSLYAAAGPASRMDDHGPGVGDAGERSLAFADAVAEVLGFDAERLGEFDLGSTMAPLR